MAIFLQHQAYLYDFSTQNWTKLPNLMTEHFIPGCGRAVKANGEIEAVVVGGSGTLKVEIFNFRSNTWR